MPLEKVRNPAKSFVQAAEELLAIVETPLEPHLDAEPIVDVHVHEDTSGGPDDALGLYLKQMGAIPLLNRSQELVLAEKLERTRDRYRRSVFCAWTNLDKINRDSRLEDRRYDNYRLGTALTYGFIGLGT